MQHSLAHQQNYGVSMTVMPLLHSLPLEQRLCLSAVPGSTLTLCSEETSAEKAYACSQWKKLMKQCNHNLFTTEEATRYHMARRQAQQALWKLNLFMLLKVMALQDPVLRDIRAKKRTLC